MKKTIFMTFFLTVISLNGQKIVKDSFTYESKKINYYINTNKNGKSDKFYVIISSKLNFQNNIDNCIKKKLKLNSQIYILNIPFEFKEFKNKEQIVLEFISDLLNKNKLVGKELWGISDLDYFSLYNEIRAKNRGIYNYGFLNEIKKNIFLSEEVEICDKLQ